MSSCSKRSVELRRARPLLGTLVEVQVAAPSPARADCALRAGFAAIERVQASMSFHDPASDLSRLNRDGARGPVRVHPWLHTLLRRAQKLHAATDGLFDIAVAPALVRGGWLPRTATHAGASRATTADLVLLTDNRVRFRRPLLIDLGGVAKGFAVDQAVAALRRHGATAGIVNAGGDLRVFGAHSATIHIRLPESPGEFLALDALRDTALATSAHYFAQRRVQGTLRAPIFHPHLRRFAAEQRSVSVQARECWLADALCKVVWLAGPAASPILRISGAQARVLETPRQSSGREARRHAA
ncbi:MAG: FAD:protein FMN transferase [Opitutae bacterium]|nr:FAD:protein FMN transferase [Opitutae bacterium]